MNMSMKLIVVLTLFVAGISGRPYSEENAFDCAGKNDGYYADVSDPKAFYSCHEGSLLSKLICEDGFHFDGADACVPDVTTALSNENEKESNFPSLFPPKDNDDDDDDDDDQQGGDNDNVPGVSKKKIYNIEITKNIFPRSIVIIGKMNREQKNK